MSATSFKRASIALGVLQVFIALGAIPSGVLILLDPSGSRMGWTPAMLAGSPFNDFLVPGLVLLIVVGLGNLFGAWASLTRKRYAGLVAIGLGLFLMTFEVIQFLSIGFSWLQAIYFVLGAVETTIGWLIHRRAPAIAAIA